MKKNKMMRVASALLVAVLMTTSVISGTFAKYVTQDSASDEARVAKWGVVLQVAGNLYGEKYNANSAIDNKDGIVASSTNISATTDVVAPGTKNENGFAISLKGQPEVAGKVTTTITTQNILLKDYNEYGVMVEVPAGVVTEANFTEFTGLYTKTGNTYTPATSWSNTDFYTLEDVVDLTADYYPVIYNLAGATNTIATPGAITADSLNAIASLIDTKLGFNGTHVTNDYNASNNDITVYNCTATFSANQNLADVFKCNDLKITWEWKFCNNDPVCDDASGDASCDTCKADTILALLMADTTGVVVKTGTNEYTTLKRGNTETTKDLVFIGDSTTDFVACLNTMFDIEITVEQVD